MNDDDDDDDDYDNDLHYSYFFRLNVAITRAKSGLIVIGEWELLSSSP